MVDKQFTILLKQNLHGSDEFIQEEKYITKEKNQIGNCNNETNTNSSIKSNLRLVDLKEENLSFNTPKIQIKKNLCIDTPKQKRKLYKDNNIDNYFFNDPQQLQYQKIHERAQVSPFEINSNGQSLCSQELSNQNISEIMCEENNILKRCCSYLEEAVSMQSPQISPNMTSGKQINLLKLMPISTRSNSSIEMEFQSSFHGQKKYANDDLGNNKFLYNQPIEEREQEDIANEYEENLSESLMQRNIQTVKKDHFNELMINPVINDNKKIYNEIISDMLNEQATPPSKNLHKNSQENFNFFCTPNQKKNYENNFQFNKTIKKENHLIKSVESNKVKLTQEENQILQNDFLKQNFKILQKIGTGFQNTKVFKIQSKIDGIIYALKSISFKGKFCKLNSILLSEVEIRTIIRDICLGFDQIHSEKLYHLNLKPENILLSKMNKYKLSDIGQGIYSFNISDTFTFIQSYDQRYSSLEFIQYLKFNKTNLFESNPSIDFAKVDIYALGAIIYQLCIGQTLPNAGEEWKQLRNNQFKKLEQLSNYSNSLKELIKQMMNKHPIKRLSAKQILECLPNELELELKWHKNRNELLKKKAKILELQLIEKGFLKKENSMKINKSFC